MKGLRLQPAQQACLDFIVLKSQKCKYLPLPPIEPFSNMCLDKVDLGVPTKMFWPVDMLDPQPMTSSWPPSRSKPSMALLHYVSQLR